MKEVVKHNFLESDQKKKKRGLNTQTHTYLPESILYKPDHAALLFMAQGEMLTMALPLGFVLGTVPFNILINYLVEEMSYK